MDDPVQDITAVVHKLTQGSPDEQQEAINTYFAPNASFTHPLCRTGSFNGSRQLILGIYRWYKIMSPRIEIEVTSIAFDEKKLILYLTIHQIFALGLVPFHQCPVTLTAVLRLSRPHSSGRYYIQSQEDLYQTSEFVKFLLPFGVGSTLVVFWQLLATMGCAVMAMVFAPLTWLAQAKADRRARGEKKMEGLKETRLWSGSSAREIAERISGASGGDGGSGGRQSSLEGHGQQEIFGNMVVVKPD
ncbi:hypothetical protein LTR08_001502 [Meristemomyces frigidus]|nr:hypothetical protein LTR08_001502 [Meristemomyces frigidus]